MHRIWKPLRFREEDDRCRVYVSKELNEILNIKNNDFLIPCTQKNKNNFTHISTESPVELVFRFRRKHTEIQQMLMMEDDEDVEKTY